MKKELKNQEIFFDQLQNISITITSIFLRVEATGTLVREYRQTH